MSQESVKVAITLAKGSVAVMQFMTAGRSPTLPSGAQWIAGDNWERPATLGDIAAEIAKTFADESQPPVFRIIQDNDIPTARKYRDSWIDTGTAIICSMPVARQIHMKLLRAERTVVLEQLDINWMRAVGQKNDAEVVAIEAQRQRLRDMPTRLQPQIDRTQSVDELEAIKL